MGDKVYDLYVVEYSKTQNCFHVTTLEDSVKRNLQMFEINNNNDYQIIKFFPSYEGAYDWIKKNKK